MDKPIESDEEIVAQLTTLHDNEPEEWVRRWGMPLQQAIDSRLLGARRERIAQRAQASGWVLRGESLSLKVDDASIHVEPSYKPLGSAEVTCGWYADSGLTLTPTELRSFAAQLNAMADALERA
jgi:hypothetical protein